MNIRMDSTNEAHLYAGDKCPFCGRTLPENAACACGVWKRVPLSSPSYLIELTADGPKLAQKEGYFSEQYNAAKAEREAKVA